MGSFAKRAKALIVFTTGLVPLAAAQAQDTPGCEFKLQISKVATAEGNLFTRDEDPTILGWMQIQVEAAAVKPANKELLVSPTAMVSASYYWSAGALTSYAIEVRNPYVVAQGENGPVFDAALDVDGAVQRYTMQTFSFYHFDPMADATAGNGFGALKKDLTLTISAPDRDPDGISYSFGFPRGDFAKAYKAGQPQFAALMKKVQAGTCQPLHQLTSTGGSDDPSAVGCFLTTAACEGVGLADDCWELRTLRRFRDGWLAGQAGGTDDIAAYYAQAPAIAARLKGNQKALLRLYWTRILPSAVAAQCGANRLARAIYSKGMRELTAASA